MPLWQGTAIERQDLPLVQVEVKSMASSLCADSDDRARLEHLIVSRVFSRCDMKAVGLREAIEPAQVRGFPRPIPVDDQ
jgi:hypothetical protein